MAVTRPGHDRSPRPRWVLVLLCILLALPAWAQDASEQDVSVFAPFVSRIRISTRDPQVRLSWQDSTDVHGGYKVYRHTAEITVDTFRLATLVAQVEPGTQSFIDTPDAPGDYYYAVIAESTDGESYDIFIPYRNTTSTPVTITNIATVVERAARVRSISAVEDSGSIMLAFDADQVGRDMIVYRSSRPFQDISDLVTAGVVATLPSSVGSAVDYPVPGVPYYYAVLDSALIEENEVTFRPGENTTIDPVEIPLETVAAPARVSEPATTSTPPTTTTATTATATTGTTAQTTTTAAESVTSTASTSGTPAQTTTASTVTESAFAPTVVSRRPLPLPFLQLSTDLQTGHRIGETELTVPDKQPVSAETEAAMDRMLARLPAPSAPVAAPTLLPDDTLPDPKGAEYTLRTILDGPFHGLAWEEAILQLNNFMRLPLSDEMRSRAVFYRAQCYYFTGDVRRAFVEFLLARDQHFTEVESWLDIILSSSGA